MPLEQITDITRGCYKNMTRHNTKWYADRFASPITDIATKVSVHG